MSGDAIDEGRHRLSRLIPAFELMAVDGMRFQAALSKMHGAEFAGPGAKNRGDGGLVQIYPNPE
ncbi:hypothetical protein ATY75_23700 [Rhizobium sp. N122]|nr:hypothetical protein ATY75_23700 [Rhizobium sp. N122]